MHMAVMAYLLQEYSNEPVDVARVMLMCLLHDVVEIDAGDTYAYDTDGLKTQKAREDAAKQRIYSLLPDDQKRGLMAVLTNLRPTRPPRRTLPTQWTICSRFCSTTATAAATGPITM